MAKKRKQHSADFKAKVALEALKGQRTANEIAGAYGVHPVQVANWKKKAVEALPNALSDGRARSAKADEKEKARLYEQIGKLQMELEWLKKRA